MKSLFLILVLALAASAQTYIGKSKDGLAYFVDKVERKGDDFKFAGIISTYKPIGDKVVIDEDNFVITIFTGTCKTYEYTPVKDIGYMGGKMIENSYKPELAVAKKQTMIWKAIDLICTVPGQVG